MTMQIEEQEDDTYKVICSQCQHFIRVDEKTKNKLELKPESFKCELCYTEEGQPRRLLRFLTNCAKCGQTFGSETNCECLIEASAIKVVYDPKNVWMKKDWNDDIKGYNSKTQRNFNNRVRNKKVEAEERQVRVDKNLIEMVGLLKKLVQKNV